MRAVSPPVQREMNKTMERGLLPMRPEPCHHDSPVLRGTRDLRHRSYIPLTGQTARPIGRAERVTGPGEPVAQEMQIERTRLRERGVNLA